MKLNDAGIYNLKQIFVGEKGERNDNKDGVLSNKPRVINIPAYQRPYRWEEENISQLFEDYYDNATDEEKRYFLGSSVIVKKTQDNTDELIFDVVDGQQRITTLYLLNYIRYLLKREYITEIIDNPMKLAIDSKLVVELQDCYVELIGKNKNEVFQSISNGVERVASDLVNNKDTTTSLRELKNAFYNGLGIATPLGTIEETEEAIYNASRDFFNREELRLRYTRERYISSLKEAMAKVYIKKEDGTYNYTLKVIGENPESESSDFSNYYTKAMKMIFNKLWEKVTSDASNTADAKELCKKATMLADEIVNNLELCIIMTSKEEDAYKLFEVLNDRSLDVSDLELIKNLFYQYYCRFSGDSDDTKDENITALDEIWTDKIFGDINNTSKSSRFISYLSAVYLTSDTDLLFKDDIKFKDSIEKNYFIRKPEDRNQILHSSYNDTLAAFNVYLAIKIIIDKYNVKFTYTKQNSLAAENDPHKSISYKAINLLIARDYHAVIPALTNVIISTYCIGLNHRLCDVDFEDNFKKFIDDVLADSDHQNNDFKPIHKCSYYLWRTAIMAKDYNMPREIAKDIISKNGLGQFDPTISFNMDYFNIAKKEMPDWINSWKYSSSSTFVPKVLLLNLTAYDLDSNGKLVYRASQLTFNPKKLELDHLEANRINPGNEKQYYLYDDKEKRNRDVNSYLGNFMILDEANNNIKNNVPLKDALDYYDRFKDFWLVKEIKDMIASDDYFDKEKQVPKETFFTERTKRLKEYFINLMNLDLSEIRK